MALSYSGIVNYGKVTLPSVESWGTNMNILKDPPKSVHTRKIDKVGETSAITTSIDESGDRFCEAINYYARGQNPMVSVSYGQGQQKSSMPSAVPQSLILFVKTGLYGCVLTSVQILGILDNGSRSSWRQTGGLKAPSLATLYGRKASPLLMLLLFCCP